MKAPTSKDRQLSFDFVTVVDSFKRELMSKIQMSLYKEKITFNQFCKESKLSKSSCYRFYRYEHKHFSVETLILLLHHFDPKAKIEVN